MSLIKAFFFLKMQIPTFLFSYLKCKSIHSVLSPVKCTGPKVGHETVLQGPNLKSVVSVDANFSGVFIFNALLLVVASRVDVLVLAALAPVSFTLLPVEGHSGQHSGTFLFITTET